MLCDRQHVYCLTQSRSTTLLPTLIGGSGIKLTDGSNLNFNQVGQGLDVRPPLVGTIGVKPADFVSVLLLQFISVFFFFFSVMMIDELDLHADRITECL